MRADCVGGGVAPPCFQRILAGMVTVGVDIACAGAGQHPFFGACVFKPAVFQQPHRCHADAGRAKRAVVCFVGAAGGSINGVGVAQYPLDRVRARRAGSSACIVKGIGGNSIVAAIRCAVIAPDASNGLVTGYIHHAKAGAAGGHCIRAVAVDGSVAFVAALYTSLAAIFQMNAVAHFCPHNADYGIVKAICRFVIFATFFLLSHIIVQPTNPPVKWKSCLLTNYR